LSGEPWTSLLGTLINLFIDFVGRGCPADFFDPAGGCTEVSVTGDDKVTTLEPARHNRACAELGFEATYEGDGSLEEVPYLGRYHYNTRGKWSSAGCLFRALTKFHCCTNKLDRHEMLRSKACSLLHLERDTPVLGAIAYHVCKVMGVDDRVPLDYTARHLRSLSVADLMAMGPPPFNEDAAAVIAFHEGWSLKTLRSMHSSALGGEFPHEFHWDAPEHFAHYMEV
jgi:hypothetical protein